VKRPAKKSTDVPTTSVVIRDTPGKKLTSFKLVAQVGELILNKSDNESWGKSKDEGDDVNDDDNDDDNANDDDSRNEDDDGNDAHESERTNLNDDENASFTLKDYDEEEHDEEYESDDDNKNVYEEEDDDLYKDVDVRSLGAEHEKERKGDEEMTDADQNVSQEKSYEQVIEDAHDESSTQASSLFTVPEMAISKISTAHTTTAPLTISMITPLSQLRTPPLAPTIISTATSIPLYIDGVEKSVKDIIKDEVITQLPQILPKEVSDFATSVIQSTINKSLENVILAKSSSQLKSTYEAAESLIELELKKILLDKIEKNHEDEDKDEDPPVGSNQRLKKRKTSKDAEPPKGSKSKESKSSSSKGTKPQPKSSGKSTQAGEPVFEAADTEMQQDQGIEFGHTVDKPDGEASLKSDWFKKPNKPPTPNRPAFNFLKGSCKSFVELKFHFEECYKVLTDRIDWNYPEGHEYPFDLSKPLPLIKVQGRQVVPADYLFNNDLEYLKGGSSGRKCTTSTTKTRAAKYDNIEGIEDMVPKL
ncbi:hypothetical protein Tco_0848319, partial [Tanacetum coccineum]